MTTSPFSAMAAAQRAFFRSGATLPLVFRQQMLDALSSALHAYEQRLADALWKDLHKSYEEAYLTEFSIIYAQIRQHKRHLRAWARPQCKGSSLALFPGRSKVITEPLGSTLIIAPWNYPVHLLLNPLVGAISAGCTAMLKPSPYTPNVSAVLSEMIASAFDPAYIALVQGNREVNQQLLELRWDLIFFTGSPSLGKKVMEAAAQHLTPVVLELGGKSPCIIDKDADIDVAAKRVAWGKVLNAGQTCIAPDYLMVHEKVKDKFLKKVIKEWRHLLTKHPEKATHFVRIVNDKAMDRLISYLPTSHLQGATRSTAKAESDLQAHSADPQDAVLYFGGSYDRETRFFHPTILTNVCADARVMQEEIFGPIFPVMTFSEIDEVIDFVNEREKPLALYYFGQKGKEVLARTSSGGACINDVIMHIANENMPFGGVGHSGMGAYHGKESFLAFSHRRAVVITPTWVDMPFRYMPYRFFKWIKSFV